MSKSVFRIAAPIALLALGGCATGFRADVARFQQLPPAGGQTFIVQAEDPKLAGGIEFSQYASLVTQKMTALGYQPVSDPAAANLVVKMDYAVDNGRERIRSTGFGGGFGFSRFGHGGFYRPYGFRRSSFFFGFHDPFLFGPGFADIDSYTVFTSDLDLKIERAADGQRLFEGRAKAISRDDRLPRLVPNLIEAMFTGFPGNSGETIRITVPPPERG